MKLSREEGMACFESQVLLLLLLLLGLFDASGVVNVVHGISLQSTLMPLDNQTQSANVSRCEGIVLLSHNGTQSMVCDEFWSPNSPLAHVICREAGCGSPISKWMGPTFQSSSVSTVKDVECNGTESSTSECQQLGDIVDDCNQQHIATLMCDSNHTAQLDNDDNETVHLVGGRSKCDGYVELLQEERWGLLCSSALQQNDAYILCNQVGCKAERIAFMATSLKPHLRHEIPVWSDYILCQGNESSLWMCDWKASNSCTSGQHLYLHCLPERLEESWLVWMTISFAALMIVVFCWVRVIKSWKSCIQHVQKYGLLCFTCIHKVRNSCRGMPTRRRRVYRREPPELRVQETHSPPSTPLLTPNVEEVNALLAPHGFRLNNTITPPPSYMNALKVLSRPLENTQTPPPSYLEALKILSRPIIVHVPAASSAEEEEQISRQLKQKTEH